MLGLILIAATFFLAYSNGANDNFKGVATLFGSQTTNYKKAIWWATLSTFAGSICSIVLASRLIESFSGRGLVPDGAVSAGGFLPAVAAAAGLTVMAAAVLGLPVSTTHALTGALLGAGIMSAGWQVNFGNLRTAFLIPLVFSPLLAVVLASVAYMVAHRIRIRAGITKEWCICAGAAETLVPVSESGSTFVSGRLRFPEVMFAPKENCTQRYTGSVMRVQSQTLLDALHFTSAGAVSFARGLNDTPKILALLLTAEILALNWNMAAVAAAMALGGLLNARRVAITMSRRITSMNHGQGFVANAITSLLVVGASYLGVPVSTTHVSCGSLFGIGLTTGQADIRLISQILGAWFLTLPVAALLSAGVYSLL